MTDILLEDNDDRVTIAAKFVNIKGSDLLMDRRSSPDGPRRALVHTDDDKLVVNYFGDYPGGVELFGEVHVSGRLTGDSAVLNEIQSNRVVAPSAVLDEVQCEKLTAPVAKLDEIQCRMLTSPVLIHGAVTLRDKLMVPVEVLKPMKGSMPMMPGGNEVDLTGVTMMVHEPTDVGAEIKHLRAQIASLQRQVERLVAERNR